MLLQVIGNGMQINSVGTEGLYLIRPNTDNVVVRMHINGRSMRINHLRSWNGLGVSRCRACLGGYLPNPCLGLANPPMPLAARTFPRLLALAHGTNTLVRGRVSCQKHKVGRGQEGDKGSILPDGIIPSGR